MGKYRGIKDDFFNDQKVAKLSYMGQRLWVGMWTECDDAGICRGNPYLLKGKLLSYDAKLQVEEVETQLITACLLNFNILIYQNEQPYFFVRNLIKHQSMKPTGVRVLADGEEVIYYKPKGNFDACPADARHSLEAFQAWCQPVAATFVYEGPKKNEFRLIDKIEPVSKNTIWPDPKSDKEYARYILSSRGGVICPKCERKYSQRKEDINDRGPQIDHIIPVSKGGDHSPENLQIICARCNKQKYNLTDTDRMSDNHTTDIGGVCVSTKGKEKRKEKGKEGKGKEAIEDQDLNEEHNFLEFWEAYPRQDKEEEAQKAYDQSFLIVGHSLLMRCVYEHKKMKNENPDFIPQVHTFLAKEPWLDLPKKQKAWRELVYPPVIDPITSDEARKIADKKLS